jgi:hypothetical protein
MKKNGQRNGREKENTCDDFSVEILKKAIDFFSKKNEKKLTKIDNDTINIIRMSNEKRRISFLFYVLLFGVIVLGAQFLHEEKSLQPMDECPICLWQINTVALAGLYLLLIFIIFTIFRYLYFFIDRIQFYSPFHHYFLRGPPGNQ